MGPGIWKHLERIPHTSKRNANLLKANLHFESHLHVPKESIDLKVAWNLKRNATWHHRPWTWRNTSQASLPSPKRLDGNLPWDIDGSTWIHTKNHQMFQGRTTAATAYYQRKSNKTVHWLYWTCVPQLHKRLRSRPGLNGATQSRLTCAGAVPFPGTCPMWLGVNSNNFRLSWVQTNLKISSQAVCIHPRHGSENFMSSRDLCTKAAILGL